MGLSGGEGCEWDTGAQQFKAFQGSLSTDDGDFFYKQVKLTGLLPKTPPPVLNPPRPALPQFQGNLTERGDDWAEAALGPAATHQGAEERVR